MAVAAGDDIRAGGSDGVETRLAILEAMLLGSAEYSGKIIQTASFTTDSSNFTTAAEVEIGTIDFPQVNGSTYLIFTPAKAVSSGADNYQFRLREDTTGGTEMDAVRHASQTVDQVRPNHGVLAALYTAASTATKTIKVTAQLASGAGTGRSERGTTYPMIILVMCVTAA